MKQPASNSIFIKSNETGCGKISLLDKFGSPLKKNNVLERGLDMRQHKKRSRGCLFWAIVNSVVLAILLYDICHKCNETDSPWFRVHYTAIGITALAAIVYFIKYFSQCGRLKVTKEQIRLLTFLDNDKSFIVESPVPKKERPKELNPKTMDTTIFSWHSLSFNESRSPSTNNWWTPQKYSPKHKSHNSSLNAFFIKKSALNTSSFNNRAAFHLGYPNYKAEKHLISDENSLREYLEKVSQHESNLNDSADLSYYFANAGEMNSFWNYCSRESNMLSTTLYQLAPSLKPATPNKQVGPEYEGGNNSEVIERISAEKLSRYVINLRMWIASTILHRLVKEFELMDIAFKQRGLLDMQLGSVGLDRLKKTVENQQFVSCCLPMLPLIVPFLELSNNQEYLVKRIRELAQGSCIADYRWNAGSAHQNFTDEPTDSAILFHVFCVYLDSQLMPLPQGCGRSFYGRYILLHDENRSIDATIAAVQNRANCAILCTNPLKPKFNFISGKHIHMCAYNRNNLFYVIIQFLIYLRTYQESALEGVNLGKTGFNILGVIEN